MNLTAPRWLAPIFAAAAVAVLSIAGPGIAAGHGDEGEMTVTKAEPAADGSIDLEVGILFTNDQELAEEATVTAMLTGPAGETRGPVVLPRVEGARYAVNVVGLVPGSWSATITSADPASEATATFVVAPATSVASATTSTTTAGTTTTTTTATATTTTGTATTATTTTSTKFVGRTWLVFGLVVMVGAGGALWWRSGRSQ